MNAAAILTLIGDLVEQIGQARKRAEAAEARVRELEALMKEKP